MSTRMIDTDTAASQANWTRPGSRVAAERLSKKMAIANTRRHADDRAGKEITCTDM